MKTRIQEFIDQAIATGLWQGKSDQEVQQIIDGVAAHCTVAERFIYELDYELWNIITDDWIRSLGMACVYSDETETTTTFQFDDSQLTVDFQMETVTWSPVGHKHLELINDELSNDEVLSDDEMVEVFIKNGMTESIAREAISFRDAFLTNPRAYLAYEGGSFTLKSH